MLLRLRVTVPPDRTGAVRELFERSPGTAHLAVLPGVSLSPAGVLSLTSAKSGALVGVFISVTTVPAAGAMALGLALGESRTFVEAAAQLGVNLVGILVAATVTLLVQKAVWRQVPGSVPRMSRVVRPRG